MDSSPSIKAKGASLDLTKDLEFQLEFDIEEDIEGELEDFVRLARLGLHQQARDYFQQTLQTHLDLFPVLAEYSEFLISEREYEKLQEILPRSQEESEFSDGEWELVKLLQACGQDADPWGVEMSGVARDWYYSQGPASDEPDGVKLQCVEIFLEIMRHNLWTLPMRKPPKGPDWLDFPNLIPLLVRQGKFWEAHKIMKLLYGFGLSSPDDARDLHTAFCEGIRQSDTIDDLSIVARLSVTNDYLNHRLFDGDRPFTGYELHELNKYAQAVKADLLKVFSNWPEEGSRHTETYRRNVSLLQEAGISDTPMDDSAPAPIRINPQRYSPVAEASATEPPPEVNRESKPLFQAREPSPDKSVTMAPVVVKEDQRRARSLSPFGQLGRREGRGLRNPAPVTRATQRPGPGAEDLQRYAPISHSPRIEVVRPLRDRSRSRNRSRSRSRGHRISYYDRASSSSDDSDNWADRNRLGRRSVLKDPVRRGLLSDAYSLAGDEEGLSRKQMKMVEVDESDRKRALQMAHERKSEAERALRKSLEEEKDRMKKAREKEDELREMVLREEREKMKKAREKDDELRKMILREEKEKKQKEVEKKKAEEEEFNKSVRERLGQAGYTEEYINDALQRSKSKTIERPASAIDLTRPTYIKVNRKYLDPETLDAYQLPWEWDSAAKEFLIIKKYVDHSLQDKLFEHTRRRRNKSSVVVIGSAGPVPSKSPSERSKDDRIYVVRSRDGERARSNWLFQ